MREYLRRCAKVGIVVFCVWHMVAVGTYSIPGDAQDGFSQWIRTHVVARIAPYVLLTSQWQQWNLFSPDPLRRVITYRIERLTDDGTWAPVGGITPSTYGLWRHAVRFKLLGQALAEDAHFLPIAERAARVLCREWGLGDDDRVRVWRDIFVVPHVAPSPTITWWKMWVPHAEPSLAIETNCRA